MAQELYKGDGGFCTRRPRTFMTVFKNIWENAFKLFSEIYLGPALAGNNLMYTRSMFIAFDVTMTN